MAKTCKSVEDTIEAGKAIAKSLSQGDVVSLHGALGAGKTHFVKGIASALGASDAVSSPTFTILHEYAGSAFPIYHVDFYRLESIDETLPLGLEDCFAEGVTIIEWGNKFPEILPPNARHVRFEILPDGARNLSGDL